MILYIGVCESKNQNRYFHLSHILTLKEISWRISKEKPLSRKIFSRLDTSTKISLNYKRVIIKSTSREFRDEEGLLSEVSREELCKVKARVKGNAIRSSGRLDWGRLPLQKWEKSNKQRSGNGSKLLGCLKAPHSSIVFRCLGTAIYLTDWLRCCKGKGVLPRNARKMLEMCANWLWGVTTSLFYNTTPRFLGMITLEPISLCKYFCRATNLLRLTL